MSRRSQLGIDEQERVCRAVGRALGTSLEQLAHLQNVCSPSLLFGRC